MNILKLLLPVGFVQVRNFSGTYYKFDIYCSPKPAVPLLQEMKKLIYINTKILSLTSRCAFKESISSNIYFIEYSNFNISGKS